LPSGVRPSVSVEAMEPLDDRPTHRDDVLPADFTTCFGCGDDNPGGLHLHDIRREGDVVRATLRARPDLQGFPGVLHGGVAVAALDELMGYACRMLRGTWAVTAKMELRFRRPITDTDVLTVEAGIDDRSSGKRFVTWGKLIAADGSPAVTAEALFVSAPPGAVG
jgi:acyl-coenzyme A thioesterase PaaI-like protein